MPGKQRFRPDEGLQFTEQPTPEGLELHCQPYPLSLSESKLCPGELLLEHAVLFYEKVLGITFMIWLHLRLSQGQLSTGICMHRIAGIGLLGGMGFTMSILVAKLGFDTAPETVGATKTAILLASLLAGLMGVL